MPIYGSTEFKSLKKKYGKGIELRGKTLGVIGLGRIGQQTAKYALGMGMKVIGTDSFAKEIKIDLGINGCDCVVTINTVDFETVLKESDFISLHVPAQADGKPVIGKAEIEKMKKGVVLINLARGGIINEMDLLEGLNSGKVRGAAIDVYDNEPTPNSDILGHENLSLTPHTGAATVEAQDRIGEELAQYIMDKFPL
jgi:D-3-phosphoglycerate dehydrogenase